MLRGKVLRNVFGVSLCVLVSMSAFGRNKQEVLAAKQRVQKAEAACGDPFAKFTVQPGALNPPTVSIGKNEARVYVIQDTVIPSKPGQKLAGAATIKVGIQGRWVGATSGRSYIVVPVQAGENHFCGRVEVSKIGWWTAGCFPVGNTALLRLQVVAGKTYYVRAKAYQIDVGVDDDFICAINLDTVNPDEGKLLLAESLPAVWKQSQTIPLRQKKSSHP